MPLRNDFIEVFGLDGGQGGEAEVVNDQRKRGTEEEGDVLD